MKSALILYPHQLYAADRLPKVHTVIMVEEPLYFGVDQEIPLKLHKQKLILQRASMRRYVGEVLWPAGFEVDYVDLDVLMKTGDVLERARKFDRIYIIDPVDETLTARLLAARREADRLPPVEFLPNPQFLLQDHEVRQYLGRQRKQPFAEFYQWQRERFNVLIDDYKPAGGRWMMPAAKTERLPGSLPNFGVFGEDKQVKEAIGYVDAHFPDNPGSSDFIWPTNHAEAAQWLHVFVDQRLDMFGSCFDHIDSQAPWLYHSVLSSSLNIGLISPQQAIEAALHRHAKRPVDIANLEAYIRQILGWREFVRGQYLVRRPQMLSANTFRHHRKLTPAWYGGRLGLPPFDNLVRKLQTHAYAHHNERLAVAGNLMLLAEIHPAEIRRWFSELFIDAQEWAVLPNVYSLSQFTEHDSFYKAPVCPSNTLMRMSDYERGDWADVWDGLFWRFIENNKTALRHDPAGRVLVQRFERLNPDRKRIIGYRADDFLDNFTA
jgi:deoxyribodipyrimidine photolyase-related protein